jgi:hypothetical protein
VPVTDPSVVAGPVKLIKAQALLGLKDDPRVDGKEILRRFLDRDRGADDREARPRRRAGAADAVPAQMEAMRSASKLLEDSHVFSREIPNGEAMVDTDPIVFDTPVNKTVGFTLIFVDDTPIVLLPLEKQLLTNGGEVEVALPSPVFRL